MKERINNTSITERINMLTAHMKEEVLDFIDFLLYKNSKQPKETKRVFGSLKGKIKMASDFND
jgi:hypothetical protein